MPVGVKVVLESPGSSEQNEEEESPDMDLDFLDDYDSEEDRRQKKKKKVYDSTSGRVMFCGCVLYMYLCCWFTINCHQKFH